MRQTHSMRSRMRFFDGLDRQTTSDTSGGTTMRALLTRAAWKSVTESHGPRGLESIAIRSQRTGVLFQPQTLSEGEGRDLN